MDVPEANPWSAPAAPAAAEPGVAASPESEGHPRRRGPVWRGATAGFRLTSYVAGPIIALIGLLFAAPTALALGAGRGFGVHPMVFKAVGGYLGCAVFGAIFGGAIGLLVGLMPAWVRSRLAADRPIRLLFWRKEKSVRIARRRRRWLWVVGALVWLVLVAVYAVGVYLGRLVDRRLGDAIAVAHRDDPNWQINDLMAHREPVPDRENSALVVGEVVSLLHGRWPPLPAPVPDQPPGNSAKVPIPYNLATATPENVRLDAATAEELRLQVAEHKEAVRLGRTVADYTRGWHELMLGRTLIDTLLTETDHARSAARFLAADAMLRAHDGDFDGALDSCRAVIGVARSIGDEPFLISELVHVSIGSEGIRAARRALGQGEPSDAALSRIQLLLLDELKAPLLLWGMRGERATLTELIRRIGTGELPISSLSDERAHRIEKGPPAAVSPWGRLSFDNQRAVALEWMNNAVSIARRPTPEQFRGWELWGKEFQRVRRSRIGMYTATLPLLITPAINAGYVGVARYQAELGATAVLVAAERHRRKTGSWPNSLDSIATEILRSPPSDPFTGRPFLLDRRDGRLIVHSVGPNLRDDHGADEAKHFSDDAPDDVGATAWDLALRRQSTD